MTRLDRAAHPHYVYRCYDAEGSLLYVGMTYNPPARMRQHAKRAEWFPQAVGVRFIVFPSLDYARQKEREAIIRERPQFNKTHRDWQPWRVGLLNPDWVYDERRDLPPEDFAKLCAALDTIFKRPEVEDFADRSDDEPRPPTVRERKREALRLLKGGAA